jgi:hypothetical protein
MMIRAAMSHRVLYTFAALFLCSGILLADSVSYTEDGIDFELTVDDLGGTVNVMLTMDTTNYTGDSTDALHATGFKIFGSDLSASASLTDAPGATTDWFLKAGGANANTTHPANDTTDGNSGFITIIFDDMYGPAMDGSTYTFKVTYTTATNPIDEWSLKGITVATSGNKDGDKSMQWSSGGLEPDDEDDTPVPEPGLLLLLGLGGTAILARRRRAV